MIEKVSGIFPPFHLRIEICRCKMMKSERYGVPHRLWTNLEMLSPRYSIQKNEISIDTTDQKGEHRHRLHTNSGKPHDGQHSSRKISLGRFRVSNNMIKGSHYHCMFHSSGWLPTRSKQAWHISSKPPGSEETSCFYE